MADTPQIARTEALHDTVMLVGVTDQKLIRLLERLGYGVIVVSPEAGLASVLSSQVIDLVLLDARGEANADSVLEYLRADEPTRRIPVVLIGGSVTGRMERVERLPVETSPAVVSAKIATLLRLRKIEGATDSQVTLAEANAALRDFTTRFRKELEEARQIQRSLLPASMPDAQTFSCAAHYQPLDEVGGDWYFAEARKSGCLALQIADVTGHGLSAAFIGSMAKLAMNAAEEEDPGKLLTAMNRLMSPQLPEGRFVTMSSVLIDPQSRVLKHARAGHPPPLLKKAGSNEAKELKAQGFALGFFPDAEYASLEERLEPGDILLLYTDGISEAQNRSLKMYGVERLVKCLVDADPALGPAQIVECILTDFNAFRDGRLLKDDVTLVVVKGK